MISVSQAVQSLVSANSALSVQLSRTALIAAASSPPVSDVILSLGTAFQGPLLYTASGLLTPASTNKTSVPAPNVNTTVEPTAKTNASPAEITTVAPAASGPPTVPTVVENAGTTTATVTPMAANFFIDPDVKALADFTANPVHGNLATALYINAAIYRAKQFSSAALVSAIDLPGPVTSLNAINVDIADLSQQQSERQNRENPARSLNALS